MAIQEDMSDILSDSFNDMHIHKATAFCDTIVKYDVPFMNGGSFIEFSGLESSEQNKIRNLWSIIDFTNSTDLSDLRLVDACRRLHQYFRILGSSTLSKGPYLHRIVVKRNANNRSSIEVEEESADIYTDKIDELDDFFVKQLKEIYDKSSIVTLDPFHPKSNGSIINTIYSKGSRIAQTTMRGQSNWHILPSTVLERYETNSRELDKQFKAQDKKLGYVDGIHDRYRHLYMSNVIDDILIGYTGSMYDAGQVMAPLKLVIHSDCYEITYAKSRTFDSNYFLRLQSYK